jgi:quinol monooxygenase YgiN
MVHVIAIITAHPGKRAQLLELFQAVIQTVREEQGCIEYGVAVDAAGADPAFGPDTYVVVEKWESLEALKAHSVAPHMKAFGAAAKDLIARRAVHVLEPA